MLTSRQKTFLLVFAMVMGTLTLFFVMRAARLRALTNAPDVSELIAPGADSSVRIESAGFTAVELTMPGEPSAMLLHADAHFSRASRAGDPVFMSTGRSIFGLMKRYMMTAGMRAAPQKDFGSICLYRAEEKFGTVFIGSDPARRDQPAVVAKFRFGKAAPVRDVALPQRTNRGTGMVTGIHGEKFALTNTIESIWRTIAAKERLQRPLPEQGFGAPETGAQGDLRCFVHVTRDGAELRALTAFFVQEGGVYVLHLLRGPESRETAGTLALMRGIRMR